MQTFHNSFVIIRGLRQALENEINPKTSTGRGSKHALKQQPLKNDWAEFGVILRLEYMHPIIANRRRQRQKLLAFGHKHN